VRYDADSRDACCFLPLEWPHFDSRERLKQLLRKCVAHFRQLVRPIGACRGANLRLIPLQSGILSRPTFIASLVCILLIEFGKRHEKTTLALGQEFR